MTYEPWDWKRPRGGGRGFIEKRSFRAGDISTLKCNEAREIISHKLGYLAMLAQLDRLLIRKTSWSLGDHQTPHFLCQSCYFHAAEVSGVLSPSSPVFFSPPTSRCTSLHPDGMLYKSMMGVERGTHQNHLGGLQLSSSPGAQDHRGLWTACISDLLSRQF